MNPNTAPYAGGGGMSGVVKPGMQPPKSENPQVIMSYVAQVLQNQGSYGGWKGEVPIKNRVMNVYQMITSLRLIQPRIDLQQAAQAALSFEQKAFQKANEKSEYEKECNEKLLHIKDTRQRQAAVALQSGMIPQAGTMQNQMQGGFPPQMNRAMQSSPIPGQPQMGMGVNDPAQQAVMQQRAQQQQSAMLQQRAQQRPGNGFALLDELSNLSAQELEQVSRVANQILAKTSPEELQKLKMNLSSNMTADQRQYLSRNNMDPMTYFFRSQALGYLRRHRRPRVDQAGHPPNGGMDSNAAIMGDPMMNQRPVFQNMMGLQRSSLSANNPGQGIDTSGFMGNVENIQGQQADGMRSQEAGQLVVPASSSQMNQQPFNNPGNLFPQQMGQNNQGGMNNMTGTGVNPQMFAQQHAQNGSNGVQDRMQFQAQQSQAQAAQAQARAQAAQKAQLAMSAHGGQPNPQSQSHLSQSSPVMPMLNQPMAPGQMSPVQVPGQTRPPSRPMNMGQQQAGMQGGPQPGMQGRPQIPATLPQAVQEQLSHMSNEQIHNFLVGQRRAAMANNMARNASQQAASQNGQAQAMFNNQMGNNARMRNQVGLQQGMNTGPPQVPQIQGQQQLSAQQRQQQQQRQNELWRQQLIQQNSSMEMTVEQAKEMDRANFPPSIINNNPSQVPKHIKTWGQLKQWASSNSQASNGVDISKLMTLQKLHFGQIVAAQQAKNLNGQGPGAPAHPFQGPQSQMSNAQKFPGNQTQGPVNMPMRPISAQDILVARQKLGPPSHGMSDDQIRELLRQRQRQVLMTQARTQANGNMPTVQGQMMTQPSVTGAHNAAHANPPAMPQPMQNVAEPQPSNQKVQPVGAFTKGGKAPAGKQAPKKRVNDDAGEVRAATATPQQPQPVTPATVPTPRPGPMFTQEQYAAMSPQQRLQVETQMRRQQQNMLRGPILNKIQAEEAWQKNIPPQLHKVYEDLKAAPPANPHPMTPEQKSTMSQQLMENLDVLGRLDALVLQGLAKMPGQEKNVKNLLAMRVQIMRQFKPGPEWIINDHFTITPDYLTGAMLFIRKLFQLMLMRLNQQRPNPNQPPVSTAPTAPAAASSNTALNATNLQQLQQQEEAFQRARRASSQSAAVAPAPFGAPSPQGVPHAYGVGGLAPDKLKLPPPKKRKPSQAGVSASPVQSNAPAVSAATAKYTQAVGDARSTAAALAGAFRCSVVECQYHFQGFPTQAALDKHVQDTHQVEEEAIDDPLQYFIDSINIGLGLDGKFAINQPATGSTLQPGAGQGVKTSPGPNGTKQTRKRTHDEIEAKDPWADCPISLEKIHDAFEPLFTECQVKALGHDPYDFPKSVEDFLHPESKWEPGWSEGPKSEEEAKAKQAAEKAEEEARWEAWLTPWTEEMIEKCSKWTGIPRDMMFGDDEDNGMAMDHTKTTGLNKGAAIAIAAV
ncbi:hypothetical protein N7492_001160 [Penicillium capsulatum]|uniref:Mediator complex subunit 15 KIX domain-containing protein n=1 Tax=Penicillium capsulatum TaxID=69766 RepID=A0A9W9IT61_9EURO|nr:hypothetical protein N7492_001160 [Penicillium capsulatum]KAJ6129784.1 hypothetical protein N7512_002564 [Penicillium capsulatum]